MSGFALSSQYLYYFIFLPQQIARQILYRWSYQQSCFTDEDLRLRRIKCFLFIPQIKSYLSKYIGNLSTYFHLHHLGPSYHRLINGLLQQSPCWFTFTLHPNTPLSSSSHPPDGRGVGLFCLDPEMESLTMGCQNEPRLRNGGNAVMKYGPWTLVLAQYQGKRNKSKESYSVFCMHFLFDLHKISMKQ